MSRLLAVALGALLSLVMATALALVLTSGVLKYNTNILTLALEGERTARDIQVRLLFYEHQVDDAAKRGEEEPAREREDTYQQLSGELVEAHAYIDRAVEREVVDSLGAHVDDYFKARRQAVAANVPLGEALARSRLAFDAALADAGRLAIINADEAASAQSTATRWNHRADIAAFVVAMTVVVAGVGLAVGARQWVYAPLVRLAGTIQRYTAGDFAARAAKSGPAEIGTIAQAFNEMADTAASQRKQQLDFLAAVAHDLRNPLAAMKFSLARLGGLDAPSGERAAQILSLLDRQIDRLEHMVGDLLEAARVEAGELALDRRVCDLRDVARDAAGLYLPTLADHELDVEIPYEPLAGLFDAARIHQVLDNLLSNAIKYSPTGGRVRLALEREEDEAVVTVSDEGVGIPAEEVGRLFEPFQRAPSARKVAHGLGLGLWVARRIVEAHGGRITLSSVPGKGSTFRIWLPLATAASSVLNKSARSA